MLSESRKQEISEWALKVNDVSEGYQLIHACFAVEKIINERINESFEQRFGELRKQLEQEDLDSASIKLLLQKKSELEKENRKKRISIFIRYIDSLTGLNASTTRVGAYKNTFVISLPEELKKVRNCDGSFNYEVMKNLRKLMAHELGHILLHTEYINEDGIVDENGDKEKESDYFAERILKFRRKRNEEFYRNRNFENI